MNDITIVRQRRSAPVEVDLSSKPKPKAKTYEIAEVELSKNIQKFDKKTKVYTENPYSFNSVSLKRKETPVPPVQTAGQMIADPTYNSVGKFLGLDNAKEWNRYYDKVYTIVEWARKKASVSDKNILSWISGQARRVPNMGARRVDDLYIAAKLYFNK